MARPGVEVTSRALPAPRGLPTDTGVWFVVGPAQKGSLTKARQVRNMTEFERHYGTRQTYSTLWDSLDTFFREGGATAYVSRIAGPGTAVAGVNLGDGSLGTSLRVDAKNGGTWGNSLTVEVVAGTNAGEFVLVIRNGTTEVDRSPSLVDQSAAVAWSSNSEWVTVTIPGGASALDPAVAAATALAGGADDNTTGITEPIRQAGLALFPRDLGPGQVSIPGNSTAANVSALIAHADANNRVALADTTDTASRSALVTEVSTQNGKPAGAAFAPWVTIPGLTANTTRTVPPSALVAGLIARSDSRFSPNVPAAGGNGIATYATGVSQAAWTDADRQLLNEGGVNVIRTARGQVQLYGYRTLGGATSPWLSLSNQRLRMAIVAEAEDIAEQFLFDEIDGRGRKTAEFAGALTAMLTRYYNAGSLYGDTSADAFDVNVGNTVNTPQMLADNQLRAVIGLRMSPFAELVAIEVVKVAITQNL